MKSKRYFPDLANLFLAVLHFLPVLYFLTELLAVDFFLAILIFFPASNSVLEPHERLSL